MPVLNEERHLEEAVGRVLGQDYPGELEVVLAIGPEQGPDPGDRGGAGRPRPRIRVVETRPASTPPALNVGIAHVQARHPGPGRRARRARRRLHRPRGRGARRERRRQRRWRDGGRGPDADREGGRLRVHVPARPGRRRVPPGRRGRPGRPTPLPGGVPAGRSWARSAGSTRPMHRAQDWELNYRIRTGRLIWFTPELR